MRDKEIYDAAYERRKKKSAKRAKRKTRKKSRATMPLTDDSDSSSDESASDSDSGADSDDSHHTAKFSFIAHSEVKSDDHSRRDRRFFNRRCKEVLRTIRDCEATEQMCGQKKKR